MSTATTASRTSSAVRIASKRLRSSRAHGMPNRVTVSSRSTRSRSTVTASSTRILAPPVARGTGSRVLPSAATPSKKPARHSRQPAQPVTAPPGGNRTDCSMIRCSGTVPSTLAGT
jgi:hypothetical protein